MMQEHPYQKVQQNKSFFEEKKNPKRAKRKARRQRNPFKPTPKMSEQAGTTVRALFFSPVRARSNEKKKRKLQDDIRRQIKRYKRKCTRDKITPRQEEMELILEDCVGCFRHRILPPVLENERKKIDGYAHFILKLWYLLGQTPYAQKNKTHMHLKDHLIGSLYLLQQGLKYGTKTIFPEDKYLLESLPPIQDLPSYGHNKRALTIGKNNIYRCLRSVDHTALDVVEFIRPLYCL